MTDEVENTEAESKTFTEADLKAYVEKETAGLKSKVDELLTEKKTASQRAKEAEERARMEAEERAKKENDFESLFKSSQEKTQELEQRYNELQNSVKSKEVTNAAKDLSMELASGTNAKLLSKFIKDRLDVGEDGSLIVLGQDGGPSVASLADLKKEIMSSGEYDSLLDSTRATGGGAAKSNNGGAIKQIERSEFDGLSQQDRAKFIKSGGKVID